MKKVITCIWAISFIAFSACNNGTDKKVTMQDSSAVKSMNHAAAIDTSKVTEVSPSFTNVDSKIATSISSIVDNYLRIKNGLVNDNAKEAANGGDAMAQDLKKVDRSLFTSEQKKIYDGIEDDLQEHAEHIGENARDIEHQREHFSMMSEDVYDLVKAFGGGRILYNDFCPMYQDGKGAMWLSDVKEIKNPYYGDKMPECGEVQEKINK